MNEYADPNHLSLDGATDAVEGYDHEHPWDWAHRWRPQPQPKDTA